MPKRYQVRETLHVLHYVTADSPEHARDMIEGLLATEFDCLDYSEITAVVEAE